MFFFIKYANLNVLLGFRGEDNKQLVKICANYMDICSTHPHPKLHCKFGLDANTATFATDNHRHR